MSFRIVEIEDFESPELDIFARMSDSQLMHCREPEQGLFIVESCNVILRALRDGYQAESLIVEKKRLQEITGARDIHTGARDSYTCPWHQYAQEIPNSGDLLDVLEAIGSAVIYTADVEKLNRLVEYKLTGGVICAMRRRELPTPDEVCRGARRIVVLEKVMNPINVGSIFRSAAALNIDAVLLTAGSADPLYRRSSRVSMGTVFQVPWTYLPVVEESRDEETEKAETAAQVSPEYRPLHPRKAPVRPSAENPGRYVAELHRLGFRTAALALTDRSVSIMDPELMSEERLAIIMGTEGEGLFPETMEDSDYTVKIPMSHGVDSLNVAAASAVAFWQLAGPASI